MLLWTITITLFNEKDQEVAQIVTKKDFATLYAAEAFAHSEGQKACDKVSGFWYKIEVE